MKYFYSAAVMGYGWGRWWHKFFDFPNFKRVTKTLTYMEVNGLPFAVCRIGKSVWNKVGLHNPSLVWWYLDNVWEKDVDLSNIIVSIAGPPWELQNKMIPFLNTLDIAGIEINYSCPNHKSYTPLYYHDYSKHPVYLKLRYDDDPYQYDLDNITGIRLNSVPAFGGGMSGKYAKKYNWQAIKNWTKDGINVAGCSFTSHDDIVRLEDMGVKEIGIGSTILTYPRLIESLREN